MKALSIRAQAASIDRGEVLVLVREGNGVRLARVKPPRLGV